MRYTIEQLQALATSTGFPDPALAASVAMAESGGDPCAQGDPNIGKSLCDAPNGTSQSFGLWQVNTPANPQYDAGKLLDARYNARAAFEISRSGTYWKPWTTYRTGAYQRWYPFVVHPPGGGDPIIPTPVTPPVPRSNTATKVAVAAGIVAVLAAASYGAYKAFAARPTPRSLPLPPVSRYPLPVRRAYPPQGYVPRPPWAP